MPRIKNLKGTSGCKHYGGLGADSESKKKCSVNGCNDYAIRACHVIHENQNCESGKRYIVYMCPSHNANYKDILDVGKNRIIENLDDCNCGYWESK